MSEDATGTNKSLAKLRGLKEGEVQGVYGTQGCLRFPTTP